MTYIWTTWDDTAFVNVVQDLNNEDDDEDEDVVEDVVNEQDEPDANSKSKTK